MNGIINTEMRRISKELIGRFEKLPTTIVSDAMNRLNSMDAEMKPIAENMKIAGPALTVQCIVGDNLIIHKAIYTAKPGDIIVVDARGHKDTSVWGHIMTLASKQRNIQGVVIDGSIRDVYENKKEKYPIFCKGCVPAGSQKNWGGNINVPIKCAGACVNPGDLILGDDDGVVVVPKDIAGSVLKEAEDIEEKEEKWIEGIKNGKTTLEIIGLDKKLELFGIEKQKK